MEFKYLSIKIKRMILDVLLGTWSILLLYLITFLLFLF